MGQHVLSVPVVFPRLPASGVYEAKTKPRVLRSPANVLGCGCFTCNVWDLKLCLDRVTWKSLSTPFLQRWNSPGIVLVKPSLPLKLSSPAEFMINLSIPNFIALLVSSDLNSFLVSSNLHPALTEH